MRDVRELLATMDALQKEFQSPVLVEEFVDGREFYVGVWGNDPVDVLPISEMDFSHIADPLQRISAYEVKWEEGTELFNATPAVCPAEVDDALAERVRDLTRRAYQAMRCRDYAHVDIRVRDGQPYLLEVNPACDLSEGMGFARQTRAAGYTYAQAIERIARFAAARMPRHEG